MELVVSRYQESTTWLSAYKSLTVTIYDKSGEPGPNSLPNQGREAHTWLHHIVTRYETLADLTIFLQGSPFDHVPDLFEKIWSLSDRVRFQDLCDNILCETATGDPGQPGIPIGGMYERLFDAEPPRWFLSHAAACFAVSKSVILSRSRAEYSKFLRIVLEEEMGPWTIERLWRHVFVCPPVTEGIVTAASSASYADLQLLIRSLQAQSSRPVAVFDLGLGDQERAWLRHQPGISLHSVPPLLPPLSGLNRQASRHLWLKPFLLFQSPFDQSLWIDPGCTVLDDLSAAFEIIRRQPLLCRDERLNQWPEPGRQASDQVPPPEPPNPEFGVHTAVVGVCRQRDHRLLAAWGWMVESMIQRQNEQSVRCHEDHWALHWAILQCGLSRHVRSDLSWNTPAEPTGGFVVQAVRSGNSVTRHLQQRYPGSHILRWNSPGGLSKALREEWDSLFACRLP